LRVNSKVFWVKLAHVLPFLGSSSGAPTYQHRAYRHSGISAATAAEVQKIADEHLWSFSKTLGVLIEKALQAKVLK
jgi:hypothetical protein